jgi:hypothetical protein
MRVIHDLTAGDDRTRHFDRTPKGRERMAYGTTSIFEDAGGNCLVIGSK